MIGSIIFDSHASFLTNHNFLISLCDKIVFLIAREVLNMKQKKRGEMAIVESDIGAAINCIMDFQPVGPYSFSNRLVLLDSD
jgi:hypothetical protein